MKKWTRYLKLHRYKIRLIYWLLVVFTFIFVVLPIFFFFYLFDEDQVKQLIIEQFDSNNYHVEVLGHVEPKFWHGLSLGFQDVEVDTRDYDTLFKIRNMSCQLSWFDLVFARYKVRRMTLNDVEINEENIIKKANAGNIFNLSNARADVFSRITMFDVYGIHAVGDKILYKLSDGSIKIRQVGASADFQLGFKLDDKNVYVLTSGKLYDISANKINFKDFQIKIYNGQNFQLKLDAYASYDMALESLALSQIQGDMGNNEYKSIVKANDMFLNLNMAGVNGLSLSTTYGNELITHNLKVMVNQLKLSHYTSLFIDKIKTDYSMEYNGSKLELISTLNDITYTESAISVVAGSCDNLLNLSSPNFATDKFIGRLSGSCSYIPKQSLLDLDFSGNLNNAPLKLKMQLYNSKAKPYLILSGNMDELDLSRIKVNKEKFLPLLYDKNRLPFDWLSLINLNGDLTIKHFALDRINLNNVITQFAVMDNTLNVNKLKADVYKGVLNGRAKIEKIGENEYNISAKQVINNVNLQDMFSDLFDVQAISGKANLIADITMPKMNSYSDLYHNLNGNISIGASYGAFQGVDFNLFVNPDGMNLTNKKSTAFEQLQANFNFTNGVSKNGQIRFSSKYVIATGNGVVDFDNAKINYNLSIKSALPHNDEQINSVLIPVIVSGDLFSPKVNIKNIHLYSTDIVAPASVKPTTKKKKTK